MNCLIIYPDGNYIEREKVNPKKFKSVVKDFRVISAFTRLPILSSVYKYNCYYGEKSKFKGKRYNMFAKTFNLQHVRGIIAIEKEPIKDYVNSSGFTQSEIYFFIDPKAVNKQYSSYQPQIINYTQEDQISNSCTNKHSPYWNFVLYLIAAVFFMFCNLFTISKNH